MAKLPALLSLATLALGSVATAAPERDWTDAIKDALRARSLRTMLITIARQNREGGGMHG